MPVVKAKMKPYIQPFEQYLAELELKSLVGQSNLRIDPNTKEAEFKTCRSLIKIADKLTYWEKVESDKVIWSLQSLRESTVNVAKNGVSLEDLSMSLPLIDGSKLPNRRCLRYATHGIHEYKGKFFPQLVRSLMNIAGLNKSGQKILDPTCGSGTTLVEGMLGGCHGIGIDLNPLSVFMTKTKCSILKSDARELLNEFFKLKKSLLKKEEKSNDLNYFNLLPNQDKEYLKKWFDISILKSLDIISIEIRKIKDKVIRDFFLVSLSNILRSVSWQKIDDLRVRKEIIENSRTNVVEEFLIDLEKSLKLTLAFIYQNDGKSIGNYSVYEGDSSDILKSEKSNIGKVDAIITSPPYATALPYLDTDRLSLMYLGLLPRNKHRKTDIDMIGNREITESQRKALWEDFLSKQDSLPESIVKLIKNINILNLGSDVGFRRKNLSALLGKYFLDMKKLMDQMYLLLKNNGKAFVVIGNNYTVAGGKKIHIDTIGFLADIAEASGFNVREEISMEMLVNRNVHTKNSTRSESILWLEK